MGEVIQFPLERKLGSLESSPNASDAQIIELIDRKIHRALREVAISTHGYLFGQLLTRQVVQKSKD